MKEIRESGAAGKAAPDIASLIRATTTLDVGFAAGGGNDITARISLSESLGRAAPSKKRFLS